MDENRFFFSTLFYALQLSNYCGFNLVKKANLKQCEDMRKIKEETRLKVKKINKRKKSFFKKIILLCNIRNRKKRKVLKRC